MPLALHALATARPETVRVWVGVVGAGESTDLRWSIDTEERQPTQVRAITSAAPWAGGIRTSTGVFEFDVRGDPKVQHKIRVWSATDMLGAELCTRRLPAAVPSRSDESFNVLLVSCFYQPEDKVGAIGALVEHALKGHNTPHLVLTVGDQVYLDNPPQQNVVPLPADDLARDFEQKYVNNWLGSGYAKLLTAAPVAAIPDDHEYWNNAPRRSPMTPQTWNEHGRNAWYRAARSMYDAFQLGTWNEQNKPDYSYRIDVPPLSIFMMDNRTNRTEKDTLSAEDKEVFRKWTDDVVRNHRFPVLVTAPSLFQRAAGFWKRKLDRNLANFEDYGYVMEKLFGMAENGCPVLTLSGDVHYPRVTDGHFLTPTDADSFHKRQIIEVIASPACLVAPFRHGYGDPIDRDFHPNHTWGRHLKTEKTWPGADGPLGNHVALLRFRMFGAAMADQPSVPPPLGLTDGEIPSPARGVTLRVDTTYFFSNRDGPFRHYDAPPIFLMP